MKHNTFFGISSIILQVFAILLIVFVVYTSFFSTIIEAQTSQIEVPITIDIGPEGLSGATIEFELVAGPDGEYGDMNQNGRGDFDDLVKQFINLITDTMNVDTRRLSINHNIVEVQLPEYGLDKVFVLDPTYGKVSFADLDEIVQGDEIDWVLLTVVIEVSSIGTDYLKWNILSMDDDSGNEMESSKYLKFNDIKVLQ